VPWQRRHSKTRDRTIGGAAAVFVVILVAAGIVISEQAGLSTVVNDVVNVMWNHF
jgi:hypothetical protein